MVLDNLIMNQGLLMQTCLKYQPLYYSAADIKNLLILDLYLILTVTVCTVNVVVFPSMVRNEFPKIIRIQWLPIKLSNPHAQHNTEEKAMYLLK